MIPVSTHYDRIAFDQLAAFSNLFIDYSNFTPQLAPFFEGDYRNTSSFEQQALKTLNIPRDRDLLADILLEQNSRWGLDEKVRHNIEQLRSDNSVVVVTGQQLGIFLSPLFIPYKTLTTIRLASELTASIQRPVIPVFWLHGEDHDFEETAPFTLINSDHSLITHQYTSSSTPGSPVGRMKLSHSISDLLDELTASLPPSPNKQDLIHFLRDLYVPGVSLLDAFALLLKRIFKDTGLVLFSVDDSKVKEACLPIFEKEIQHPLRLSQAVESTSIKLASSYHTQVTTNPINLFLMEDDSRRSINLQNDQFKIKDHPHSVSQTELLDRLQQHPDQFSPNVILRPIVQDFFFPSIAYIAGPGEIAYFAQCKEAYQEAGIPMPLIFPRASITLIEPDVARVLERYPYELPDYNEHPLKLFRRHALDQLPIDLETAIEDSISQIHQVLHSLRDSAMQVHPSLYRSAESTKIRFENELLRYKEQVIKAQKKNEYEHLARFTKATTHLFPRQKLQERVISPLHFLNKYGLDFFTTLMNEISLDTTEHQIIRL